MEHTVCAALGTVFWKAANLGSSSGSALGSHPSQVLQLSHETVYFTVIYKNRDLPTPRKVTVSLRLEKGPAVLTGPTKSRPSCGIVPMLPASRGLSVPHGTTELPSS